MRNLKRERDCKLSGDGRHGSPGHNPKYVTYSLMNQQTNEIVAYLVTQVTEAGNSNRVEKLSFTKVPSSKEVKQKGICVNQLTTAGDTGICKYMREKESKITQPFDVWHVVKNIKKRLHKVGKNKSCENSQKWKKSISNHFWWDYATCKGNEEYRISYFSH